MEAIKSLICQFCEQLTTVVHVVQQTPLTVANSGADASERRQPTHTAVVRLRRESRRLRTEICGVRASAACRRYQGANTGRLGDSSHYPLLLLLRRRLSWLLRLARTVG